MDRENTFIKEPSVSLGVLWHFFFKNLKTVPVGISPRFSQKLSLFLRQFLKKKRCANRFNNSSPFFLEIPHKILLEIPLELFFEFPSVTPRDCPSKCQTSFESSF